MQICDYEFRLRRQGGNFLGNRSPALVDIQVSLLNMTHDENERARIRRQQFKQTRRDSSNPSLTYSVI